MLLHKMKTLKEAQRLKLHSENSENSEGDEFTFSVETKIFTLSLIDQSIDTRSNNS